MLKRKVGYLQNVQFSGEWLTVAYQILEIIGILLVPGIGWEKKFKSLRKGPSVTLN